MAAMIPNSRGSLAARLNGYRDTALLYVAAKLRIADSLSDGPKSSAELAAALDAHEASFHRILRGLALLGVCAERKDGKFELGPAGQWMKSSEPGSVCDLAILCGEEFMAAWGSLPHTAMTGETAFDHVFGESPWERRKKNPALHDHYTAWMSRATFKIGESVARSRDFSRFRSIVDLGGGSGDLLAAMLQANPNATGILADQAHVATAAAASLREPNLRSRWHFEACDFFQRVPSGADLYLMKSVIHDWDDEHSLAILKNCRNAMGDESVLLLIERLLPERAIDNPNTVMLDLHMMAMTGGRERTEAEYRALLEAAGFRLAGVAPTDSDFSLLEGRPCRHSDPHRN